MVNNHFKKVSVAENFKFLLYVDTNKLPSRLNSSKKRHAVFKDNFERFINSRNF